MKVQFGNFQVNQSKVFEIKDSRILGSKELSPAMYYNFRNSVANNNAGIAAFNKKMYVISLKENSEKLLKSFSELGLKISDAIKDPERIKQIISNENKLLRTFF